jgi:ribonuclease D
VAPKLIATSDELEEIARSGDTDVPVLRGWRRKLFGEDALALKRGELALVIEGGEVAIRRADDRS